MIMIINEWMNGWCTTIITSTTSTTIQQFKHKKKVSECEFKPDNVNMLIYYIIEWFWLQWNKCTMHNAQ